METIGRPEITCNIYLRIFLPKLKDVPTSGHKMAFKFGSENSYKTWIQAYKKCIKNQMNASLLKKRQFRRGLSSGLGQVVYKLLPFITVIPGKAH